MQNLPVEATKKTKKSWKFTEKMSFSRNWKRCFFSVYWTTPTVAEGRVQPPVTRGSRLWKRGRMQTLSWAVTLAGCMLPLAGRCCFIERKWLLHEAAQVWGFFSWITSACLPKKDISAEFFNMALFWHIKGKAGRSQTFLQSTVKSPKLDDSLKWMNSTTWRRQTCRFSLGWTATLKEQCNSVRGIYVNMKEPAAVVSYGGCEQCKETAYLTQKT